MIDKPVIIIFSKPISDCSVVLESSKNILSEGRADINGKKFAFGSGKVKNAPDAEVFYSLNASHKPMFAQMIEENKKEVELKIKARKFSSQVEYNHQ